MNNPFTKKIKEELHGYIPDSIQETNMLSILSNGETDMEITTERAYSASLDEDSCSSILSYIESVKNHQRIEEALLEEEVVLIRGMMSGMTMR